MSVELNRSGNTEPYFRRIGSRLCKVSPDKWNLRYSSLDKALRMQTYIESAGGRWITIGDMVRECDVSRKTALRIMQVMEGHRGYEVMGGEFPGDALLWRYRPK